MKYVCELCGTIYDEAEGISFAELPQDYSCPSCGSEKEAFTPVERRHPVIRQPQAVGRYDKYPEEHRNSDR